MQGQVILNESTVLVWTGIYECHCKFKLLFWVWTWVRFIVFMTFTDLSKAFLPFTVVSPPYFHRKVFKYVASVPFIWRCTSWGCPLAFTAGARIPGHPLSWGLSYHKITNHYEGKRTYGRAHVTMFKMWTMWMKHCGGSCSGCVD